MSGPHHQYTNVRKVRNRCNRIDTHEILKKQIYGQTQDTSYRFGVSTPGPVEEIRPESSQVGFEDVELYFDSTQREPVSQIANGVLGWDVPLINNTQEIENCVEITMGDFYFPKVYSSAGKPEFLYHHRVFVEFQGAPSGQSILGPGGNRFHWEFRVINITGHAVKLVPVRESYFFKSPLNYINAFVIRFMVPSTIPSIPLFKNIPLPREVAPIISLTNGGFGYNPARFQVTEGTTDIIGPIGATIAPGVAIFITGFASGTALVDSAINDAEGLFVITVIDATTFEIFGVDSSALVAGFPASMYVPKNRIAIPVRFTKVKDQLTNYITVGHL